ncbi:hypothetical protein PO909_015396 [Leuciscus waleckii]
MGTGDLKGCLRKLEASLRSLKYPREVDYQRYDEFETNSSVKYINKTVLNMNIIHV